MSHHHRLRRKNVTLAAIGAVVVAGLAFLPSGAAQRRETRNPQLIMSKPQTMKGDSRMMVGGNAWVHRIFVDAAPGITWIRIASGAIPSGIPEQWSMVFFDGPPQFAGEIIPPKTPPRYEGMGKDIVRAFTIYAWGKGGSLTFRYQTYSDFEEYQIPLEGQYITDPISAYDKTTIPTKAQYPEIWHGTPTITANPTVGQAGRTILITVQLPNRMRANVSRVDLYLEEPKAPGPTDFIRNYRTVPLPWDPSGTYTFAWTIPQEYYSRTNFFSGSGNVRFEAIANKPDPSGNFPVVAAGAVVVKIDGVLRIENMGIQNTTVPLGEKGEWNLSIANTNPIRAWVTTSGGADDHNRYRYVWNIDGEEFTTTGLDSSYRDTKKLLAASAITVTVADGNGNSATGTIFVGPKDIVRKKAKEMWIEPPDKTVNRDESFGLRAYALLEDGRKLEITPNVEFSPSRFFKSDKSGTFTIGGTTEYYEGTIRPATVTVRPKKRLGVRIEPDSQKIVVGQTATYDIVELFEDNSKQKVGTQTYKGDKPGMFTVSGAYQGTPTMNCAVAFVRQLGKMWLEPPSSRVNKGQIVNFRVKASFVGGLDEDITDQSVIKPAMAFSSPKPGTFTISAASTPYPGSVQTATVVVREKNRVGLIILPANATIAIGETATFEVAEQYDDNSMISVGQEKFTGTQTGTFSLKGRANSEFTSNQATITVVASKPAEKTTTKAAPQPGAKTPQAGTKTSQPGKVDDALQDILKDANVQDECRNARANVIFADLNALTTRAQSQYSLFLAYTNKFNKEVSDRTSDICLNGIVAYCFKSAKEISGTLDGLVPQILQLRNKIIFLHGSCPPFAQEMQKRGYTINSLISSTSGLGAYDDRFSSMRQRLNEAGCDENELQQLAQRIPPPPGLDPDFLQRGGIMQEIPGDAVDNDADGFQDESLEALAGYNVTFVLYDSGTAKDDSFDLSVTKFGSLGRTPVGGLMTFGRNMPPGSYVATVSVVSAPDNVGTFTLTIFQKGTKIGSLSGGPGVGASASLPFVVN